MCVVMACSDMREADEVGRLLSEQNNGCLVSYMRAADVMLNQPSGRVVLVILATNDPPDVLGRLLDWLRNRWPGCPVVVVGDAGGGPCEMAARRGGATYLLRPVRREEWRAVMSRALALAGAPVGRGRPRSAAGPKVTAD
ncbi:MAG: hypothetical protein J7M21_00980 [Planctomycetes bacterium]|nr:hypothetical protein [Planctomycetota bacterium]